MKNKVYIMVISILFVAAMALQATGAPAPRSDEHSEKEYQVKAAFIYNFMKFIEWPKEKTGSGADGENSRELKKDDDKKDEPITIGIVGDNPFGKALEPIIKKKINDRKLIVREFEGLEKYKARVKNKAKYKEEYMAEYGKALKKCHVLFFHATKEHDFYDIVELVRDNNVLTIGETKDFVTKGGVIGFVVEKKKVRFEINLTAARRAKLKISSKLLRLAKRVIKEKKTTEEKR
jgi:hypothetical protein